MNEKQSALLLNTDYEAVIGIEVHVQLQTKSKIFCSCANEVTKDANSNICNICTGQPGILPVLNKKVVEYAILAGLATRCTIATDSTFDRKHYFYPDLPKNYQITQQHEPICTQGLIPIRLEDGTTKHIRLNRIHIEEDAGKNLHSNSSNESYVDLNRAGTPLLEMVSEPDISSAFEAKAYLKTLRAIVQSLGICSGNMEEGAFRADTNISVRKKGATQLGTKCELKNINSFKFIGDAIEYELERQIELLKEGGVVVQQTRLWDPKLKQTVVMRTKEGTAEYRFFQDPDLPIIHIDNDWIKSMKATLPELPYERYDRLISREGLTPDEADMLIEDFGLAQYFDAAQQYTQSKLLINWILREVVTHLKEAKIDISACRVTPRRIASLVNLIEDGTINSRSAKDVFALILEQNEDPEAIVDTLGLKQIDSADELERIIKELIAANPGQVAQYKSGKTKLFGFFVGQMMQLTKGKGNPDMITELLKKHLDA